MIIKVFKAILSFLLIFSVLISPVLGVSQGVEASAAAFSDINDPSVFLKQQTAVTCTLSSMAMILRRTAIAADYYDWRNITEEKVRLSGWNDLGLLWNFSCYNMTVDHGYFSSSDKKSQMLDLLKKYPQGIVIYNGGSQGQNHAVALTDYDEKTDTFYVADPSALAPSGRIKLSDSSIVGGSQSAQIANLTAYWYVSEPEVKLKNGQYTAPSLFGDGSFYRITASALNLRKTPVDGVILTSIPRNTEVFVTDISDGWGLTVYNGYTGWISLEYAEKIDNSVVSPDLELGKVSSDVTSVFVGETINWNVHTIGITDDAVYSYSLYCSGELVDKTESPSPEYSFTPEKSGSYVLRVFLKDGIYVSVTAESEPVTVYGKLSIDSVDISADMIPVGSEVTCTITASGGIGKYTYVFSVFKDNSLIKTSPYSDENVFVFAFEEIGEYKFFCAVLDGEGTIVSEFSPVITVADYILGDVDGNGVITAMDARLALRHSARLITLSDVAASAADVNFDGAVTAMDARIILRYSAKLITKF